LFLGRGSRFYRQEGKRFFPEPTASYENPHNNQASVKKTRKLIMTATTPNTFQTVAIEPESKNTRTKKHKEKKYNRAYTAAHLEKHLLGYYKSTGAVTPYSYWNTNCKETIPRQTFLRKTAESGMKALRALDQKATDNYALSLIKIYLDKSSGEKTRRVSKACSSNRFLTNNEELAIVQLVRLIGSMGGGITKLEFMALIDEYTQLDLDVRERQPCSEKVMERILEKYSDLVKVVDAGSLDPARARKATTETRDTVFFKLDCFIKTLHATGKVPWESFSEVPAAKKLNMDEVSNDTTKHRSKIIADALSMVRKFQLTPEGDGRMNMHITVCITTRANGKLRWVGCSGAVATVFYNTAPTFCCCYCVLV
jgi:hypothetical protein